MNSLGKIFTVLILVMSLVYMTMSMVTYATHRNWRDAVLRTAAEKGPGKDLGLKYQLSNARENNKKLAAEKQTLQETLNTEKTARNSAEGKLESELEIWRRERATWQTLEAALREDSRQAVAAMDSAQNTLAKLRQEAVVLRDSVRETTVARDEFFKRLVKSEDELHQEALALGTLKERQTQLLERITRLKKVVSANDLNEFDAVDGVPPRLDGIVLASRDRGLIEISLGSDDGLRPGHRVELFRHGPDNSRYLGAAKVLRTQPDKSVAKIISETRQGPIEKEDRVATRLR